MRKNSNVQTTAKAILVTLLLLSGAAATSPCLAADHYVDNAAHGANSGKDWENAWQSFGDIDWERIQAGDTVLISGGSISKIYKESLVIGKSGASDRSITITRGRGAGHDGEVIIDGEKTRGILVNLLNRSAVTVSHLVLRNPQVADGGRAINLKGCSRVTIDGNKVISSTRAGIFIENSSGCTIRDNDIGTDSYVEVQTDAIYSQRNREIVFEGNRLSVNNNEASGHDECLQSFQDADLVVRGNRCEQNNLKTVNAQGIYMTVSSGTMQICGNVVVASHTYNSLIAIRLPKSGVHAVIVGNTLIGGKYGVLKVEGDTSAVVRDNVVWSCARGDLLSYKGDMKEVAGNIFGNCGCRQKSKSRPGDDRSFK